MRHNINRLVLLGSLVSFMSLGVACGTGAASQAEPTGQTAGESGFVGSANPAGNAAAPVVITPNSSTTTGSSTTGSSTTTTGTSTTGGTTTLGGATLGTTGGTTTLGGATLGTTGGTTTLGGTTGGATTSVVVGNSGSATLSGSVQGLTFVPQSATYSVIAGHTTITLWEAASACDVLHAAQEPRGGNISLDLFYTAPSPLPAAPSTYAIGVDKLKNNKSSAVAQVVFSQLNNKCKNTVDDGVASDGTVVITSVNAGISGTFNATVGQGGGAMTGTFTAVSCPTLVILVCQP